MKSLKASLLLILMTTSVAAMAEGGGDKVAERMQHAREVAMAHYQSEHDNHQQALASSKESHTEVERSN